MIFFNQTDKTVGKLAGIILALALLCPVAPGSYTHRSASVTTDTLAPAIGNWETDLNHVLDSLGDDNIEITSFAKRIERFINRTVSQYKSDKVFGNALNALCDGTSTDPVEDIVNVINHLKDYPLLRHIRAKEAQAEQIQTTFKTLSLKVNANGGFFVCVVTWPSQGPLGFKTVNDTLGWDSSDRVRDEIFYMVTQSAKRSFKEQPPQSAQEAQDRLARILDTATDDFIEMLKTAQSLKYSDKSMRFGPGTMDYFIKHAESLRFYTTASYSVNNRDNLTLEETVKTITQMEDFAMAKARLAEEDMIAADTDRDDALLHFAGLLEKEELRTDNGLDWDTLTRIRKGQPVAPHLEKTAELLKVFGRPKPYSINDHYAFAKALMAHELLKELSAQIKKNLPDGKAYEQRRQEIADIAIKIKGLADYDPRSVSVDYMKDFFPNKGMIEAAQRVSPKVKEILFMSKSRYSKTFERALTDPQSVYDDIDRINRDRTMQHVPVEVYGDEALFLSVMKQQDGSLAPTEIYTDIKGLGVENIADCMRLVNIHRHIAKTIKDVSVSDFSLKLTSLEEFYLSSKSYCPAAALILSRARDKWMDEDKTNKNLDSIRDTIRRELAQMVISNAEDLVTLRLRMSELALTGQYTVSPPTDMNNLNKFAREVMRAGRRCVAVTLTDKVTDDEKTKETFKTLEEYGLSMAKKLEAKKLSSFFLHYTGTKKKGQWRIILHQDGKFFNRDLDGMVAILNADAQPVHTDEHIRQAA